MTNRAEIPKDEKEIREKYKALSSRVRDKYMFGMIGSLVTAGTIELLESYRGMLIHNPVYQDGAHPAALVGILSLGFWVYTDIIHRFVIKNRENAELNLLRKSGRQ